MSRPRIPDPRPDEPQPASTPLLDVRPDPTSHLLERVAWLMDRAVTIPGTRVSVGLDALLGLFPGVGDVVAGAIQAGVVLMAIQHYRVPKPIAARMVANVLIDTGLGSIPIVGDLFDVFFKANTQNLKLLNRVRDAQEKGKVHDIAGAGSAWGHLTPVQQPRIKGASIPASSSVGFLLLIGGLLGGTIVLLLIGSIALIIWLISLAR
jgi:Domain of unknown function (DUF4112)